MNCMTNDVLAISNHLGSDRDLNFVMGKLVEEVGELATEVNILNGFLPQSKGGVDGVLGECNDIINCAIDLAYLALKKENPLFTIEQVRDIIIQNQTVKCEKWKKVSGIEQS